MARLLQAASDLPIGAHCVSFHASQQEACDQAVSFISGCPNDQAASYWVAERTLLPMYESELKARLPQRPDVVHVLGHSQVHKVGDVLRPVPEVLAFIGQHPEGVTAGGETLTWFWTPETIHEHLEYERWFETQPRQRSRFICPYNLRKVPPGDVLEVLRELSEHHSHVVLSQSRDRPVRLMQLFLFANADSIPEALRPDLRWAVDAGYVQVESPSPLLFLSASGRQLLDDWTTLS